MVPVRRSMNIPTRTASALTTVPARAKQSTLPRACCVLALSLSAVLAHGSNPEIPIAPGVTFVLAVENSAVHQQSTKANILQGDYEVVVTITGVSAEGVDQTASMDGFDAAGIQRGLDGVFVPKFRQSAGGVRYADAKQPRERCVPSPDK